MKKVNLLGKEYEIVKDQNDCFDFTVVEGLATDYFEPYDYIFGDYSYGKIRLKGFFESNNKKVNKINDIKNLDNYIEQFCSYNCNYFLLKKIKNN